MLDVDPTGCVRSNRIGVCNLGHGPGCPLVHARRMPPASAADQPSSWPPASTCGTSDQLYMDSGGAGDCQDDIGRPNVTRYTCETRHGDQTSATPCDIVRLWARALKGRGASKRLRWRGIRRMRGGDADSRILAREVTSDPRC